MLILFTDYGWHDPYVGQVKAVLAGLAPGVPVIDLLHAVPDFNAHAGAHLLAALCQDLPSCGSRTSDSQRFPRPLAGEGAVVLAVVDPGVGGPRSGAVLEADGRFYVGPDNGLLSVLAGRARSVNTWRISWQPENLCPSFHGRDLFAPIAALIAAGQFPSERLTATAGLAVRFDAGDLARILYLDHYGNAWTGIRGSLVAPGSEIEVNGQGLPWRRVFLEAEKGEAFWHVNSSGLVEIAVNRGSAAQKLGLKVADAVRVAGAGEGARH